MKIPFYIFLFLIGSIYAQVDFNKLPTDDLGEVEDKFQEYFYEALIQKSIENYDRSVQALLKCIELNAEPAVLYYELGKNYLQLKNFGSAEDALKKAVDKDPDNEWFLDELYGYYSSQNDYEKAIKTVKQLVKYHPDYKQDLANLYVQTKNYDEALKLLDELDEIYGISDDRDRIRNQVYQLTGRKKDQIKNLEQRLDDNPNQETSYLELIFRYSENNQKEKAFETAKELLEINPNSQLVHLALYKFYLDDNEPQKAIESMKTILKSNEVKPDAKLKVLSDFVVFVGKNPQYEAELLEATTLAENHSDKKTLKELGEFYLVKGEKEKALRYFESALNAEHDNFDILKTILLLKVDLNQYDSVWNDSSEALLKYPAQPILYLVKGVSLIELNRAKEAAQVLEEGLDYLIDDPKMEMDFYTQLSKAYTLLNNTSKAKTFIDKAKQLQSSN